MGYLKKNFAGAVLALLAASLAGATDTGTISGLVTDQYGDPVSGALVVVEGTGKYSTANRDGCYVISPVPAGSYEVSASRVGCGEQVIKDVEVKAGFRTNTLFELYRRLYVCGSGDPSVPWDDTSSFWIRDLLLRYYEPRTEVLGEFEYPLIPPRGEDGDDPEGVSDIRSQIVDEFAEVLVRPPGVVYEEGDTSDERPDPRRVDEFAGALERVTGKICGLVLDREGRPLSGASVELVGAHLSAETDDLGSYCIEHVPPGTFDVRATYPGRKGKVKPRVRVLPGKDKVISFQL